MKYIAAFFIVFVAVVASSHTVSAHRNGGIKAFQIGDLMKNPILALVQTLLRFLSLLILRLVPDSNEVPVKALLNALECQKKPTISTVLTAILNLATVKPKSILAIFPRVILNIPIGVGQLISILSRKIGASTTVTLSTLLLLLDTVLLDLVSNELVSLLNGLSSHA